MTAVLTEPAADVYRKMMRY